MRSRVGVLTTVATMRVAQVVGLGGLVVELMHRNPSNTYDLVCTPRDARREVVEQVTARLGQKATKAVEALDEVMQDHEASPLARVSAARVTLDLVYRAAELVEVGT